MLRLGHLAGAAMTLLINRRTHDPGGVQVRRAVPTLQARSGGGFRVRRLH